MATTVERVGKGETGLELSVRNEEGGFLVYVWVDKMVTMSRLSDGEQVETTPEVRQVALRELRKASKTVLR